ncbi:RNA polymerase sigma factor RpoD/SigA [Candidatus Woesearchaeota archaeon]|nr:RNA polymerase sigma factor RpoD/SigA [Candidatus Woesearchaeota archaeon]
MAEEDLAYYFGSIRNCEPLSREREAELAVRIREGDKRALDELVTSNLRFVVTVAKNFRDRGLSLSELISAGNVGLLSAAEKFDEKRGCKFISYAVWWIRQSIIQSLSEDRRNVRYPTSREGDANKVSGAVTYLRDALSRKPDVSEIADYTGISEDKVEIALGVFAREASLDALIYNRDRDCDDHLTFLDRLSDGDGDPSKEIEKGDFRKIIEGMRGLLDEREYNIIRYYFGLDGIEPMSLEEIGGYFGITRERVRQLRNRSLEKMRNRYGKLYREMIEPAVETAGQRR